MVSFNNISLSSFEFRVLLILYTTSGCCTCQTMCQPYCTLAPSGEIALLLYARCTAGAPARTLDRTQAIVKDGMESY